MKRIAVIAPAKLNLSLDVVGVMSNGYHELDMVMQAITLYEHIILRKSTSIELELPNSRVAADEKNTAYKAAKAFFGYTELKGGVNITIQKRVPVRAGMAGGSADAAGVLVGLNHLYHAHLSMSELCALGAQIGADVPFALMGGTCRVQGVGDLIRALPPCPRCWFVVVMPSIGISTPEAFQKYDELGSSVHPNCSAVERGIRNGNLFEICSSCGNALETCSCVRETTHIKEILEKNGASASLMTGSGAAVYGIFYEEEKARKAKTILHKEYRLVYLAQPDRGGARVLLERKKSGKQH